MQREIILEILEAKTDIGKFAKFFFGIELSAEYVETLKDLIHKNPQSAIRGKRHTGKTLAILIACLHTAIYKNNQACILIAHNHHMARSMQEQILKVIKNNDDIITASKVANGSIRLTNGSSILFLTAKDMRACRGRTINFLAIDELQLYSDSDQINVVETLFPMLFATSHSGNSKVVITLNDDPVLGNTQVIDAISKMEQFKKYFI